MLCVPALPSLDPGIWRGSLRLTGASFVVSGHLLRVRIGRHDVQITNPDKVFFPQEGLTKGDLVAYYLDVAPCALHHIRRRLFHMKRYPNGVEGDFFHQKRVPPRPDFVGEQFVQFPSGHSTVFAVVDNAAALAWVANLGCIELHTWHSRVDDIERPDYLLIDLDPSEGNPWELVREVALVVKKVMDELGLASYPKTSGATGLHILAPIRRELAFPDVRRFAKALAEEVERRIDDQAVATTTWRVAVRVRVPVPPHACRAWRGAAALGRSGGRRAGGVHDRDDARAARRGRRPDAR